MSRPLRFRRPGKWARPKAHRVGPARFRPRRRPLTWRQAWRETRGWIAGIAIVTLVAIHQLAGFYDPPAFLLGEPRTVEGGFTRCGSGRGAFCVIDGDTFKLVDEKFRVTGIDTAEVEAQCPAEAAQSEASTTALQGWLSRGPLKLATRLDKPTDRYGRTLAVIWRVRPDGGEERLSAWMREHGGARWYSGGLRSGWC